MTSPGTARASLKAAPPSVSERGPKPPRPSLRLLAEHPDVDEILDLIDGRSLGSQPVSIAFARAPFSGIPADSFKALDELVIVTGSSAVTVQYTDDHYYLTGNKGIRNDCLILFRHAYGKVVCDLSTANLGADAHIGFLVHGSFRETWHADFSKQPAPRPPTHKDWSSLPCSRTELNELQGIVWRGGTLCIERITLEP